MKVNVGLLDMLFGKRHDSRACMVARAISRVYPGVCVIVDVDEITILGGLEPQVATVPYELTQRIIQFDESRWVRPFSFELDLREVPARLPLPSEMLEPAGCCAV